MVKVVIQYLVSYGVKGNSTEHNIERSTGAELSGEEIPQIMIKEFRVKKVFYKNKIVINITASRNGWVADVYMAIGFGVAFIKGYVMA